MPRELRQIVFNKDEFVRAAVAHDRVSREPIISGEVIGCQLEANEPVRTLNRIIHGNDWTETKSTLEPCFIQEALIRYCLENNIMIPRDSEKSISVRKGQVALIIKLPK